MFDQMIVSKKRGKKPLWFLLALAVFLISFGLLNLWWGRP